MASARTIERLSVYRRLLGDIDTKGRAGVYSHELATKAVATATQVRRDLMEIGFSGRPRTGYDVKGLAAALAHYLDAPKPEGVALVGVGRLGRALLDYSIGRHPKLHIPVAFDTDPAKTGRVIHHCRCHHIRASRKVIPKQGIRMAILAVPAPAAQAVATRIVDDGIMGLINFSPVRLHLPPNVYVENFDVTVAMEKMAFFTRQKTAGMSEES